VSAARADFDAGRYSACGLAAVHAGISAADAVTVHLVGEVSASRNHLDAVGLLRRASPRPELSRPERQLVGLLQAKSDVEYSGESVTRANAKVMLDQADRFTTWAVGVAGRLPPADA
jgi:hypothetical protein